MQKFFNRWFDKCQNKQINRRDKYFAKEKYNFNVLRNAMLSWKRAYQEKLEYKEQRKERHRRVKEVKNY